MANTVGILISRRVFRDCLRGVSPYESFELYDLYARKEGILPVFFTLDHIRFERREVQAYEYGEDGRYRKKWLPLPRVIHNRIKPAGESPDLEILKNLPGIMLFNRDNRFDKWSVYRKLEGAPELKAHLPETRRLTGRNFFRMMEAFGDVYIKPRDKSLGMDVVRIDRAGTGFRIREASGFSGVLSGIELRKWIRRKVIRGTFLVQQAISLMKKENRPFDLRVSVQRGGDGEFQVSGIVAKVGRPRAVATNVAVGGKSERITDVLRDAGVSHPEAMLEEIRKVAVHTAKRLAGEDPGIADLGLDVGVDDQERVWIIEVNGRDLRITFNHARDWESWQRTFATPMQYARHLLENFREEKTGVPSVAILTPGNLPVYGSGSGSVEITARSVAEKVGEGHVTWLVGTGVKSAERPRPVEIRAAGRNEYLRRAIHALRRLGPDIIQIENRPLWLRIAENGVPEARKVLFMHSETYLKPPYARSRSIVRWLSGYDVIIANSRFLADRLRSRFPKLKPKVRFVRLGVDVNRFRPIHDPEIREEREQSRLKHRLDGRFVILFVGRLIPGKGVHHLIEAFAQIAEKRPEAILLIVGGSHYGRNLETPYVRKLKRMAEPLEERIRFWPFASHHRLPSIYRLADVLVTPSVCEEAFGLVNLEGMASGLPVLSTMTGGIPEVVVDGETGRLLPLEGLSQGIAGTLLEWMDDPEALRRMGEAGRRRAERLFAWERTGKKLSRIYRVLASG